VLLVFVLTYNDFSLLRYFLVDVLLLVILTLLLVTSLTLLVGNPFLLLIQLVPVQILVEIISALDVLAS
jgi:hypothetical protein